MEDLPLDELIRRSEILVEALPFIQKFSGATVVIKIGGNALVNEATRTNIAKDIVLMHIVGLHPVVVHGGGPEISAVMKRMGIEPRFQSYQDCVITSILPRQVRLGRIELLSLTLATSNATTTS